MTNSDKNLIIFLFPVFYLLSMLVVYAFGYKQGTEDERNNMQKEVITNVVTDTIIIIKHKMIDDVEKARNLNDSDVVKLFEQLVTE